MFYLFQFIFLSVIIFNEAENDVIIIEYYFQVRLYLLYFALLYFGYITRIMLYLEFESNCLSE